MAKKAKDNIEVEVNPLVEETGTKERRPNNSGSIYPIYKKGDKDTVYRWGYCLNLGKAPDGRALRHLETKKTREEVEEALEVAKGRADELRTIHLKKYGFEVDGSGENEPAPAE